VGWGVTSEDEMFIMGIYYVLDTAGLSVTGIPGAKSEDGEISVYPNPAQSKVFFEFQDDVTGTVEIYSSLGLLVEELDINGKSSAVDVADLPVGVYVYQITSDIYSKSGRFTVTR
ncbi:MAG: T9SS type A sorting domain-containing protein, partial [Flavobacteriales bacterium]|nr:T9SS type A sorting domain-containing protein [Flavobacteriales bacterium]